MGLARCVIEKRQEERTKIELNRDIQESRKRINDEFDPIVELARNGNTQQQAEMKHDRRGIEATS